MTLSYTHQSISLSMNKEMWIKRIQEGLLHNSYSIILKFKRDCNFISGRCPYQFVHLLHNEIVCKPGGTNSPKKVTQHWLQRRTHLLRCSPWVTTFKVCFQSGHSPINDVTTGVFQQLLRAKDLLWHQLRCGQKWNMPQSWNRMRAAQQQQLPAVSVLNDPLKRKKSQGKSTYVCLISLYRIS